MSVLLVLFLTAAAAAVISHTIAHELIFSFLRAKILRGVSRYPWAGIVAQAILCRLCSAFWFVLILLPFTHFYVAAFVPLGSVLIDCVMLYFPTVLMAHLLHRAVYPLSESQDHDDKVIIVSEAETITKPADNQ